jgi:hypothetical protein
MSGDTPAEHPPTGGKSMQKLQEMADEDYGVFRKQQLRKEAKNLVFEWCRSTVEHVPDSNDLYAIGDIAQFWSEKIEHDVGLTVMVETPIVYHAFKHWKIPFNRVTITRRGKHVACYTNIVVHGVDPVPSTSDESVIADMRGFLKRARGEDDLESFVSRYFETKRAREADAAAEAEAEAATYFDADAAEADFNSATGIDLNGRT